MRDWEGILLGRGILFEYRIGKLTGFLTAASAPTSRVLSASTASTFAVSASVRRPTISASSRCVGLHWFLEGGDEGRQERGANAGTDQAGT
jgi:hypothetical protein